MFGRSIFYSIEVICFCILKSYVIMMFGGNDCIMCIIFFN